MAKEVLVNGKPGLVKRTVLSPGGGTANTSSGNTPARVANRSVTLPSGEQLSGDAAMNYGKAGAAAVLPETTQGAAVAQAPTQSPAVAPVPQPQATQQPSIPEAKVPPANVADAGNVTTAPAPSKYQQAFNQLQAQGVPAPKDAGAARSAVQALTPKTPAPTPAEVMMQEDPFFAQIQKTFQEYLTPQNQRQSLVKEYQSLLKSSGIKKLDAEILNAKNIIEGTEEDIRTEVTKASGFATESQVQAMTLARNKSLIKNYSNLVETRNSAMEYVNTMLQLSAQDRAQADANFDRMMNFSFQALQYRDKMQENARAAYDRIASNIGYDGLLQTANGDPYQQALIEKTLGLGAGGLLPLAQRAQQDRALALQKENLQLDVMRSNLETDKAQRAATYSNIETDKLQRANILDQIRSRREQDARDAKAASQVGTLNGKPQTEGQLQAQGFADRAVEANTKITQIGSQFTGAISALGEKTPNFLKSSDRQSFEQARRNFINAVLRNESGATIAPEEFENAAQQYFPQPGDTQDTVNQKARNRYTVINNLYREANVTTPAIPGTIVEHNGKRYSVGTNGEMKQI